MDRELVNDRVGRLSGFLYIMLMGLGIPLLILNDPSFSTNLSHFDPLSKLSVTEASKVYYRLLHILAGIFALLYFELHFFPQRKMYWILNNWKFARLSARIGFYGQISTGIFPRDLFPIHLFAVAAFASGYGSCFVFISLNLDNQLVKKGNFRVLIFLGYVIAILVLMNTLYFRYSPIRGIWQFFIILLGLGWYFAESILYRNKSNTMENSMIEHFEAREIKGISYVMIGFGLYLIVFGLLLHFRPKMWPWQCTDSDESCQLPNVISLIIAGFILTMFAMSYQIQMRRQITPISILE